MKSIRFLSIACVLLVAAACGKKKDDNGKLAGVFPEQVFLGRTAEVVIASDGIRFSENSTVDLGADVTVSQVEVLGPSAIVAYITVAPTAAAGPRDVIVDGKTLTEAIELVSPISVTLLGGVEEQGSINYYEVENLDTANPFTDQIEPTVTGQVELTDFFLDAGTAVVGVYFNSVETPEPVSLTLNDGGLVSTATDFVTPAEVTPTSIDTGSGWSPSLSAVGSVAMGTLDLSAGDVVEVDIQANDNVVFIVQSPTDGTLANSVYANLTSGTLTFAADKATTYLLTVGDAQLFGYGPAGTVDGTFTVDNLAISSETEPNDDMGTATAIATFPTLVAAPIGAGGDVDFFSVDLSSFAGNAAVIQAYTLPPVDGGLAGGDTLMNISEDGNAIIESDDTFGLYAGTNAALMGTTGYVAVSSFDAADTGNYLMTFYAHGADATTTDTDPGNDAIGSPDTVSVDPSVTAAIVPAVVDSAGDVDHYTFTLASDAHVILETGPAGANTLAMADTNLVLYDDADAEVASNEDINPSFFGGNYFSRIEMDLTAGTYKVKAESSPMFAADDTGDYRLMIFTR